MSHRTHGEGVVTDVDSLNNRCSIRFSNGVYWGGNLVHKVASEVVDLDAIEQQRRERERLKLKQEARKQEEIQRERRRDPLRWHIRDQLETALKLPLRDSTFVRPGKPDSNDISLAKLWMDGSREVSSTSKSAMMLSARMAEKSVAQFFLNRGDQVEDVALRQLLTPQSEEWKEFDLLIGGDRCIDVKNARRSEQNPNAYVSHCVPNFKITRMGGAVLVAGALSNWHSRQEIMDGESAVRFLGLTSNGKIETLRIMLRASHLEFSIKNLNSPSFLPSWIFDYSADDYRLRNESLAEITRSLRMHSFRQDLLKPILLPAIVSATSSDIPDLLLPRNSWERDFALTLMDRLAATGPSLPVVFLSVLEHFLEMLIAGGEPRFQPSTYRSIIFPQSGWSRHPLFLFDPELSINTLIDSLETLWQHRNSALGHLKEFRLHELNVVSGRQNPQSPWQTILAYCGGWIRPPGKPAKPCGYSPLVYGKRETCICTKLVCPNCGFCSRGCGRCEPRQQAYCSNSQKT